MIIQHEGRYYIAMPESTQLRDIVSLQIHLIELLKVASQSETFDWADETVFQMCDLLQAFCFEPAQADYLESRQWNKAFNTISAKQSASDSMQDK